MARLLSHIASIMRGSVGGITYSANQFHQIIARQRTAPVNPNTNYQAMIRADFSAASQLYNALSAADKVLWREYAETCIYSGPLGNYTIPGRQMALAVAGTCQYLTDRGVTLTAPVEDPPLVPGWLGIGDLTIEAPGAGLTGFNISIYNPNDEAVIFFAFCSFAFSPSRMRYKGPFISERLENVSINAGATDTISFTGLIEDMAYFASVRGINVASPHRLTQLQIVRAIAETTAP
jgi:hypothetical protein